jgi:hypothetical protein
MIQLVPNPWLEPFRNCPELGGLGLRKGILSAPAPADRIEPPARIRPGGAPRRNPRHCLPTHGSAKAREIQDPFEQAFFPMVHLPYLQPFIDGDKRVSRLAANIPLFQRNLAPFSFVGVSEADYTDGMLAIYELNDIRILQKVFIQAYERSAQRYTVIGGAVGEPDPFRVKYREALAEQVAKIIRARCDRREAIARLRQWAQESVVESDRKRFVTAAEETLSGIHDGNFARYRVRPSEFEAWKFDLVVMETETALHRAAPAKCQGEAGDPTCPFMAPFTRLARPFPCPCLYPVEGSSFQDKAALDSIRTRTTNYPETWDEGAF